MIILSKKSFFDEGGNGKEGNYLLLVSGMALRQSSNVCLLNKRCVYEGSVRFDGISKLFITVKSVDTALIA